MSGFYELRLRNAQYNKIYHNNLCHVCKGNENLLLCSQCKSVAYCSKNHQKVDWKAHKEFCKLMAKAIIEHPNLNDIDSEEGSLYSLYILRALRRNFIEMQLRRKLDFVEINECMYMRFCEVCLSEDQIKLDCPKCHSVFFCSEHHRSLFNEEEHNKHCDELKVIWEICRVVDPTPNALLVSDIPNCVQNLPKSVVEILTLYDGSYRNLDIDNVVKYPHPRLSWISQAASIFYGLEKHGTLKNRLFYKNELNIHVVCQGSFVIEPFECFEISELTFHWITNLKRIRFIVVGQNLDHSGTIKNMGLAMCNTCTSKNVSLICTFARNKYRHISTTLVKPDAIVCFNCNLLHQSGHSLRSLIQDNVPLILTDYTFEDINVDVEMIEEVCNNSLTILVEPQINPYNDKGPRRTINPEEPIIYGNGYISVVTK